jgi:hypothetical protein
MEEPYICFCAGAMVVLETRNKRNVKEKSPIECFELMKLIMLKKFCPLLW